MSSQEASESRKRAHPEPSSKSSSSSSSSAAASGARASRSSSSVGPSDAKKTKQSEFLCQVRYENEVPEVPLAPKLLPYPFEPERLVRFAGASIDRQREMELLPDIIGSLPVDLVDTFQYERPESMPKGAVLPEDEVLLRDDLQLGGVVLGGLALASRSESAGWLRNPTLAVNDMYSLSEEKRQELARRQAEERRAEQERLARFDDDASDNEDERAVERARLRALETIETTFLKARQVLSLRHPTKPHLEVVESNELLPDTDLLGQPLALVAFDRPPFERPPAAGVDDPIKVARDAATEAAASGEIQAAFTGQIVLESRLPGGPEIGMYVASQHVPPSLPAGSAEAEIEARKHYQWVCELRANPATTLLDADSYFLVLSDRGPHYARFRSRLGVGRVAATPADDDKPLSKYTPAERELRDRPKSVTINVPKKKASRA